MIEFDASRPRRPWPAAGLTVGLAWLLSVTLAWGVELGDIQGLIDAGAYEEAIESARARLDEISPDSLEEAETLDLLVDALRQDGRAEEAETLALIERAVALKETVLDGETAELAASLYRLAVVRRGRGEHEESVPVYERALRIREGVLPSGHPDIAESHMGVGNARLSARDNEGALAHFEQALAIRRAHFGDTHEQTARSLVNVGLTLQRLERADEVGPHYREALGILQERLGEDHPDVAVVADLLGAWHAGREENGPAIGYYEQVLRIRRVSLRADHPRIADTCYRLGQLHRDRGEFDAARERLEECLRIRRTQLEASDARLHRALDAMGHLCLDDGDFARGRDLFAEVLALRQASHGEGHAILGVSFNNLANAHVSMGDYREALPLYERALTIHQSQRGERSAYAAQTLVNLAECRAELGDLDQGLAALEEACSIFEGLVEVEPAHAGDLALAQNNRGRRLYEAGRVEEAATVLEAAIHRLEEEFGPDSHHLGDAWLNLALCRREQERWDEALTLHRDALRNRRASHGDDHPKIAWAIEAEAMTLARAGRHQEALARALEAEQGLRAHLRLLAGALPERQALRYVDAARSGLDVGISSALRVPTGVNACWDALIRSRAVVLDVMLARARNMHAGGDLEREQLHLALRQARERLANLSVRGDANSRARVDEARRAKEEAERELARRGSTEANATNVVSPGLRELLASLEPKTLLVAFARYDDPTRVEAGARERYAVFVAGSSATAPSLVDLGSSGQIDTLVDNWRAEIREAAHLSGREEADARASYFQAGAALRERIWDPWQDRRGEATRLRLVLDGALHLVSFGSLPLEDGRYLIEEGLVLQLMSAERDLVSAPAAAPGKGLLIVADADFGQADAELRARAERAGDCADLSAMWFSPLPATGSELQEIAVLWAGAESTDAPVLLRGSAASEFEFERAAQGKQILHLATHGFFAGGDCAVGMRGGAGADTRGVAGMVPRGRRAPRYEVENPLALAGLALAGANARAQAELSSDDGILTAEEIAGLPLQGVALAVLSACDTGVGRIERGEGVFGLRRAFAQAGVQTLVMSLWPVQDDATREWMRVFYRSHLHERADAATSAQRAAVEILESRRAGGLDTHPFYWGAFVVAGSSTAAVE